jgi:glutathione S-transferase
LIGRLPARRFGRPDGKLPSAASDQKTPLIDLRSFPNIGKAPLPRSLYWMAALRGLVWWEATARAETSAHCAIQSDLRASLPSAIQQLPQYLEMPTMLTVYGEGRGFRVVWLLEELGLAYRLRPVDLMTVETDSEFLAINPAGFIPVLQDGETIMVESIAIVQYLLAKHGPSSLAVTPDDPAFASYLQFLHLGEAGLAGPMNAVLIGRGLAPEAERNAQVTRWALETFQSRLGFVVRRLADCPYLAGEQFTAADISVSYALLLGLRTGNYIPGVAERAYLKRTTTRPAYVRAMENCQATKAWAARSPQL